MTTRLEMYNLVNLPVSHLNLNLPFLNERISIHRQVNIITYAALFHTNPANTRLLQQLRDNKVMWDKKGNLVIKP